MFQGYHEIQAGKTMHIAHWVDDGNLHKTVSGVALKAGKNRLFDRVQSYEMA